MLDPRRIWAAYLRVNSRLTFKVEVPGGLWVSAGTVKSLAHPSSKKKGKEGCWGGHPGNNKKY